MANVLVVDDDATSRELLSGILRDEGHMVTTAVNGIAALEEFGKRSFDLVFMDIFMPGKEGLTAIKEMRSERPGVKIIAITGGSSFTAFEALTWAEQYGAVGSLTKPIDASEVIKATREAL